MCMTTYLTTERVFEIRNSLIDNEISDLLKQINWCQSQEHIIEQVLDDSIFRKKYRYLLYVDILDGIEWQLISCASGTRKELLAYLYGFLNGKESK